MTLPRSRKTARASPPSGSSLPTKFASTGVLIDTEVVRVKFVDRQPRVGARKGIGARLLKVEATGGAAADADGRDEAIDQAHVELSSRLSILSPIGTAP
jgi:hypothetical protein